MSIKIIKKGITDIECDIIVNAANSGLKWGDGVCGAIFRACGHGKELQEECDRIGGCPTGEAVITNAFNLPCKKIIHAVGPIWHGGNDSEEELLENAYRNSLELAIANNFRSVAFPLISAGIYGYPLREAWETALKVCKKYENDINIIFAVLDDSILNTGNEILKNL